MQRSKGAAHAWDGKTRAVKLVQRFGSAPNLNIHFHMLFLDGAYLTWTQPPVFRRIAGPSAKARQALIERWPSVPVSRSPPSSPACKAAAIRLSANPKEDELEHALRDSRARAVELQAETLALQPSPRYRRHATKRRRRPALKRPLRRGPLW